LLIPLFLQLGMAPCPGACALSGCAALELDHSAVIDQSLPPCHQSSRPMGQSGSRLNSAGLKSCCRGDAVLPLAVGPQLVAGKGIHPDQSARGFVVSETGSVCYRPLVATHSGEPPPPAEPPPIYRLNCDLRI